MGAEGAKREREQISSSRSNTGSLDRYATTTEMQENTSLEQEKAFANKFAGGRDAISEIIAMKTSNPALAMKSSN